MEASNIRTVIIDADFIPYKASGIYHYNDITEKQAYNIIDSQFKKIFKHSKCNRYVAVVTGINNFRKKEYNDYKHNRENLTKPDLFKQCKQYTINKYKCYTVHNVEADDLCCSLHYQNENTVLCSPDKDLMQCEGTYLNPADFTTIEIDPLGFIKKIKKNKKTKVISAGDFKLYHQLIAGDSSDGIKGLKGKGHVYAYKLLKDCLSPEHMLKSVANEYYKHYGDNYLKELQKTYCMVKMKKNLKVPNLESISFRI